MSASATPSNAQAVAAPADNRRSLGRGGALLSGAKLYFIVLGLAQQIVLSWTLQDAYGALRGALSPASITYNPVVGAGVQGLSRAVSRARAEEESGVLVGSALVAQIALGALLAAAFFLCAPLLAAWLHSPHLVGSLRILSVVVFCYGIYAPLVGVLNGEHRFFSQAALDVLSATLRTLALFGGAYWFRNAGPMAGVEGACSGFALVAVLMCGVAWMTARVRTPSWSWGAIQRHLAFVVPVFASQGVLNMLLQADTNMLRRFAAAAAVRDGLDVTRADSIVGAYSAGQLFALLPYQVLIGVSFILFPLLSEFHARSERSKVAALVQGGVRIALLVTGMIVAVTVGLPHALLRLVFPPQFADQGALSMAYLCAGFGFFALFGVFTAILNSVGRQWQSLLTTAVALGAVLIGNWYMLSSSHFDSSLLSRTAVSTSLGMIVATLFAAGLVWRETGAVVGWGTALRTLGATCGALLLARALPDAGRVGTLAVAALVAAVYVVLLLLARELSIQELKGFGRAVFRGGRPR